ncbi:hypothetical protein BZM27_53935 [Paraburkholderia steynii]|uniref:Pyridine nucleotide-disulphide oxidoreductase N-terminal domain-containing protein n=1 Tax=Paraburkholderia steynii TaxID=1245441 RepID=A0A4R0WYD2_9BURK|nr:hypothetical protein BZM27_53935 [Paraburkholderia steynii]
MGIIGAEVAAYARQHGCKVTAIESSTSPLERALGTRVGKWLASEHAKRGTVIRTDHRCEGVHRAGRKANRYLDRYWRIYRGGRRYCRNRCSTL